MLVRLGALVLSVSSSVALADSGCRVERSIKSDVSDAPTKVVFKNESGSPIKIYWLDYEGKRVFYNELLDGRSYTQDTYMTHPWVVTGPNGQCVLLFRPLRGATVATIRTVD